MPTDTGIALVLQKSLHPSVWQVTSHCLGMYIQQRLIASHTEGGLLKQYRREPTITTDFHVDLNFFL